MDKTISTFFKEAFLSEPLAKQIADCDLYELAPLIREIFKDRQPVLEAGCGSGRWCGWLSQNGIRSDGVDWNQNLCDRAKAQIPECQFFTCDMQCLPIPNQHYNGLLALGSIEHIITGPLLALQEFYRILKDNGMAIITVPYGGNLRRSIRILQRYITILKTHPLIRRLFSKPALEGNLKELLLTTNSNWFPRFLYGKEGWFFYEYEFNKPQMRSFLTQAGFAIEKEFVAFGNEGILHSFGRYAARWDQKRCDVDFTPWGLLLRKIIPVYFMGHMLCYILKKPSSHSNN